MRRFYAGKEKKEGALASFFVVLGTGYIGNYLCSVEQ